MFASTFTYAHTKLRGKKWVVEALTSGEGFAAAETVTELRAAVDGEPLAVYEDGQTLITRARSVAAGEFLGHTESDVWLTFDDDAFVPRKTLRALIDAARATRSLVGAPAINRLGNVPNYHVEGDRWSSDRVRQQGDVKLYPVHNVSFTCVAIHRSVIATLAWPQCMVTHDRNRAAPYPALFLERIFQGAWMGEDYAFCLLMHEHFLRRYLLLEHPMIHAGVGCMVSAQGEVLLDSATAKEFEAQGGSK